MPPRLGIIKVLTQDVLGVIGHANIPDSIYDSVHDGMAALLERVAEATFAVFGERLLEEATARHEALHADGRDEKTYYADDICPECLHHVLLNDDGSRRQPRHWEEDPEAELHGASGLDWPRIVAEAVKYRL